LLGFVTDGAGVVEHQVSGFDGVHLGVTLLHERADDFLGVMHVHLAAESLEVKRFLRGGHRAQYSVFAMEKRNHRGDRCSGSLEKSQGALVAQAPRL
jgi:hypothetical protein